MPGKKKPLPPIPIPCLPLPEAALQRVVFLDMDGVMNSVRSLQTLHTDRRFLPETVAALNHLMDATGATLIVSSTWRKFYSLDAFNAILSENGITARAVGATPILHTHFDRQNGETVSFSRGAEIRSFLEMNPVRRFVILDDDADMDEFLPLLVQTDSEIGLTWQDAERAVNLLLDQQALWTGSRPAADTDHE